MDRRSAAALVALLLAAYGICVASYVPALLVGTVAPLLLVGYVAQAAALAAAVGVWRGSSWAPAVVIVLGAAIVFTNLAEAFLLGIVAWGRAVLVSVVALLVTLAIAAYIRRSPAAA